MQEKSVPDQAVKLGAQYVSAMFCAVNIAFIPFVLVLEEFLPEHRNKTFTAAASAYLLIIVATYVAKYIKPKWLSD